MKASLLRLAAPAAIFVVGMAGWQCLTAFGFVAPYLLPAPSQVLRRMAAVHTLLLAHSMVTGLEILLGFVVAVVVGVLLAAAVVYIRPFEAAFYPWIIATQAIPKVALGPLFIVWLGLGLPPKVVIGALIAFFPILIDTVVGLKSIDRESIFLLQSMGARRWAIFRYAQLPTALPNLFAGMKVAITLATVGAIVGEFVGANEGLGYVLLFANGTVDTTLLFGALVMLSLLAVVFYLVVCLFEAVFIRWHVSRRGDVARVTM